MSYVTREWLPSDALTDQVMRTGCIDVVRAWSERWSTQPALLVRDLTFSADLAPPPKEQRFVGQAVWVLWSEKRATQLACWALGVDAVTMPITGVDRSVLEALGDDVVRDLIEALTEYFEIPKGEQPATVEEGCEAIVLDLDLPGRDERLRLFLPASALAVYRKTRCNVGRSAPKTPLASSLSVLPEALIAFEVGLGRSLLSLRDVRSMEVGDVIRLDTKLDGALPVSRPGSGSALFGAKFRQGDGVARLSLCRPEAVGG